MSEENKVTEPEETAKEEVAPVVEKAEEEAPSHKEVVPESTPKDDLRDMVSELSKKVDDLAGIVDNVVSKGEPDSSPVKGPWHQRRIF